MMVQHPLNTLSTPARVFAMAFHSSTSIILERPDFVATRTSKANTLANIACFHGVIFLMISDISGTASRVRGGSPPSNHRELPEFLLVKSIWISFAVLKIFCISCNAAGQTNSIKFRKARVA
jgi:hypothetical protein